MAHTTHHPHEVAHRSQSVIGSIALALAVVGAINWGLVGLFNLNLVTALFGDGALTRVIYLLVGLSGVYALSLYPRVTHAPPERGYGPDYGPGHPDFVERRRPPQAVL